MEIKEQDDTISLEEIDTLSLNNIVIFACVLVMSILVFIYTYVGFETIEFKASEISVEIVDPFKNYQVESCEMVELPKLKYLEEIDEEEDSETP